MVDIHYYDERPKGAVAAIKGQGVDLAISQEESADRYRLRRSVLRGRRAQDSYTPESLQPARHVSQFHEARARDPRRAGRRQSVLRRGRGVPEGGHSGKWKGRCFPWFR